jgi:uncharacterized membrane protein
MKPLVRTFLFTLVLWGGWPHSAVADSFSFTILDVPGSRDTQAYGINDRGQIVGAFIDAEGRRHGFIATEVPEPGTLILLSVGLLAPLVLHKKEHDSKAHKHRWPEASLYEE